ncbi:MAG: hypothetical protein WC979_02495 [Candidatus Pacearchaeota archaeon]|jgi:hypothetical protein|nr:hypothetical protein [Clostridia bacterium]
MELNISISSSCEHIINAAEEIDVIENFFFDEKIEITAASIVAKNAHKIKAVYELSNDFTVTYEVGVNVRDEIFYRMEILDADGVAFKTIKVKTNDELELPDFDSLTERVLSKALGIIIENN